MSTTTRNSDVVDGDGSAHNVESDIAADVGGEGDVDGDGLSTNAACTDVAEADTDGDGEGPVVDFGTVRSEAMKTLTLTNTGRSAAPWAVDCVGGDGAFTLMGVTQGACHMCTPAHCRI